MKKELVYLAAPYSHPHKVVRIYRFERINKLASELMRQGVKVFSPISHTHPIALAGGLPTDWQFWKDYDWAILSCCQRMIVYQLLGWKESRGVAGELAIAKEMGLPVEYIKP